MEYVYFLFEGTMCNDDNFEEGPDIAKIDITLGLIQRIKKMHEMVQDNKFATISDYNRDATYLKESNDAETYYNSRFYKTYPERLDTYMLIVGEDMCWWEAGIRYTSVKISINCIYIDILLEIETLLTRIINKDFGCSVSSIINDAIGDTKSEKNFIMFGDDEFTYITGPYEFVNEHIDTIKHIYKESKNFSIIAIDSDNVMRIEPL